MRTLLWEWLGGHVADCLRYTLLSKLPRYTRVLWEGNRVGTRR